MCPSGHASTELQNIKFLQTFSSVFEKVRAARYSRSCLSPDGRTEAESFRVRRRRRRHRRRRRRRPCPRSPTLQTAAAGSALALGREGHRRLRSEGRRREREGGQRAVNATNIFIQQVRCWPRKRSQEDSHYRKRPNFWDVFYRNNFDPFIIFPLFVGTIDSVYRPNSRFNFSGLESYSVSAVSTDLGATRDRNDFTVTVTTRTLDLMGHCAILQRPCNALPARLPALPPSFHPARTDIIEWALFPPRCENPIWHDDDD